MLKPSRLPNRPRPIQDRLPPKYLSVLTPGFHGCTTELHNLVTGINGQNLEAYELRTNVRLGALQGNVCVCVYIYIY